MKIAKKSFLIGLLCFGAMVGNVFGNLITFDDLSGGGPLGPNPEVLNGYGGLNWNNFAVADTTQFYPTYGYYHSAVSGKNSVFNPFGNPASVSTPNVGGIFNLNSAYLTFALNLNMPLHIQVEGFLGTTLLYNNTYVVYDTGPTFINFDYVGVDKVEFNPLVPQQFAMDNLDVTLPDGSSTMLLLGIGFAGALVLRRQTGLIERRVVE